MQVKRKILIWLAVLSAALAVQTSTFYLMSEEQLEERLLPDYFQFTHHSDSAYVRDFYGNAEDPPSFMPLSHDLEKNQKALKEKLRVEFIYFDEPADMGRLNEKDFNLVYLTWMQRGDWLMLSNLFRMKQVEHIIVDGTRVYHREVIYRWCFFFWISSFEFIRSENVTE